VTAAASDDAMMLWIGIPKTTEQAKEELYQSILSNASRSGYFLNPKH